MTQTVVTISKKETGIAYILWLILGYFAIHRLYLGYNRSAIVIILLCWTLVVPIIMVLYDLFMIPSLVREANAKMVQDAKG